MGPCRQRPLRLASLLVCFTQGCRQPPDAAQLGPDLGLGLIEQRPPSQTMTSGADQLLDLHHRLWVSGDVGPATEGLRQLLGSKAASAAVRARAALRLAAIAEATGQGRLALSYLDRVRPLVGPADPLWREAADWRVRIRTEAPLADVRGPVPGSAVLGAEPPRVLAAFRRAERLLIAFHRIAVAPRLDNVDAVVHRKRRALREAASAYQLVKQSGGSQAQAAAQFRLGAMHHHLAEALAFERPSGLLPNIAAQLARKLQTASAGHLRTALAHYRKAAEVAADDAAPWRELAEQEARTLGRVFARPK